MVTNKASIIKKGPEIVDTAADYPAEKAVQHPGEASIPTAQQDTTHSQHGSPHHMNIYRRSPTPYSHQVSSITTAVQKPSSASSSDTDDKPAKVNKCKNICPTPYLKNSSPFHHSVTWKTHTHQHVKELLLSDTESVTSSTLQPEDADSYNFLPFQDHIKPISRPSCISILKTQLLQLHITNSRYNKDTPTAQRQNHHTYQFLRTKSVILTQQNFYKLQAVLQHQANRPPNNS